MQGVTAIEDEAWAGLQSNVDGAADAVTVVRRVEGGGGGGMGLQAANSAITMGL